MLTLPKVVDRPETPYAAVAREVRMPFTEAIGPAMDQTVGYLDGNGVMGFGPAIFRYTVIDMPRLEVEFGFITPSKVAGQGDVAGGTLPAGRYATVTWIGPYDQLQDVTGLLIGWVRQNSLAFDSVEEAGGERFAARFELYPNGPMDEPDPQKWETQIYIKLRD